MFFLFAAYVPHTCFVISEVDSIRGSVNKKSEDVWSGSGRDAQFIEVLPVSVCLSVCLPACPLSIPDFLTLSLSLSLSVTLSLCLSLLLFLFLSTPLSLSLPLPLPLPLLTLRYGHVQCLTHTLTHSHFPLTHVSRSATTLTTTWRKTWKK